MKIKFFVFFVLFGISNCLACDCPLLKRETMVEKGLISSDVVFYGELIDLDLKKQTYCFKVIELYKGKISSNIIYGKSSDGNCDLFPFKKGFWIVYGKLNKNNTISMSICNANQSLETFLHLVPPPPKDYSIENSDIRDLSHKLILIESENENLKNWIYQLEKLRQYKQNQNTISENNKSDFYQKILIVSLILNAILFLSFIISIQKKKHSSLKY